MGRRSTKQAALAAALEELYAKKAEKDDTKTAKKPTKPPKKSMGGFMVR